MISVLYHSRPRPKHRGGGFIFSLRGVPKEGYPSKFKLAYLNIFQDFQEVYNVLNSWSPAEESIESFFEQVSVCIHYHYLPFVSIYLGLFIILVIEIVKYFSHLIKLSSFSRLQHMLTSMQTIYFPV